MPLSLRRGTVTAITEEHDRLVRLEVDGAACIAYPRLTGPVAVGDDVLVNVQARELALGSGGFDVVYANLTRGLDLDPEDGAHVMTLPYTPLQVAVRHAEEEKDALAPSLQGTPVVCCTVHSQVVPVCAALRGVRVAYVQVAGGALPVALSDALRALREQALVAHVVAAGPCLEAEVQCVNVYSALAWCASRVDAIVCSVGPGLVGTGTELGHGAVAAAEAANAASALGGRPILAVRVSDRDERERHRGVSHHASTVEALCLGDVTVAWPDSVDASGWREACTGLPLSFMGRGPDEEPRFFEAAYAAGLLARAEIA